MNHEILLIPELQSIIAGDGEITVKILNRLEKQPLRYVNWPAFPYRPEVNFLIGHTNDHIYLKFFIEEEAIRAMETKINGDVFKDSCVEFFLSFDGSHYYNFEFNCIGTPHVAFGENRHNRKKLPEELVRKIMIISSNGNQAFEILTGRHSWQLLAVIPLECLVYTSLSSLKGVNATANFYKCGDELPVPHFLSWHPVNTPAPDFHRPEHFGAILFE